jgi:hypothetical protein
MTQESDKDFLKRLASGLIPATQQVPPGGDMGGTQKIISTKLGSLPLSTEDEARLNEIAQRSGTRGKDFLEEYLQKNLDT